MGSSGFEVGFCRNFEVGFSWGVASESDGVYGRVTHLGLKKMAFG